MLRNLCWTKLNLLTLFTLLCFTLPVKAEIRGALPNCGTLKSFPAGSMGMRVTGGKAGQDDIVVVDARTLTACAREMGREKCIKLSRQEVDGLKKLFSSSGFFALKPSYLPSGAVVDALQTRIVFNDGKRKIEVVCADSVTPPAAFSRLAKRFQQIGHLILGYAPNYVWVVGRLRYQTMEGGFWTLEYASGADAKKDPYGGKFVLEDQKGLLKSFKSGDRVIVRGYVRPDQVGIAMAGTYYAVVEVERI